MERTTVEGKEQILRDIFGEGRISLAYSHNGGDVYIRLTRKGRDRDYECEAVVCVIKNEEKAPLVFKIKESVGNDSMTVFTYATVSGIPLKNDKNDIGLYPYLISTSDDRKTPDIDIMEHAAEIYGRFDRDYPDLVQIGKIFRKYVPMSYEKIREQLESAEQSEKDTEKGKEEIARLMKFNAQYKGF